MAARLKLPLVEAIRRALAAGEPQRTVARRLGVSLSTVNKIARDRWECERDDVDRHLRHLAADARRCPGCGGRVYRWPCLACEIAAAKGVGNADILRQAAKAGHECGKSDSSVGNADQPKPLRVPDGTDRPLVAAGDPLPGVAEVVLAALQLLAEDRDGGDVPPFKSKPEKSVEPYRGARRAG